MNEREEAGGQAAERLAGVGGVFIVWRLVLGDGRVCWRWPVCGPGALGQRRWGAGMLEDAWACL